MSPRSWIIFAAAVATSAAAGVDNPVSAASEAQTGLEMPTIALFTGAAGVYWMGFRSIESIKAGEFGQAIVGIAMGFAVGSVAGLLAWFAYLSVFG